MSNVFMIVLELSMIYMPLALGGYISFSLLKVPDLSLETAYLMGAFCAGLALQVTQGYCIELVFITTLLASIFGGMLVGLLSSCMTYFGNIPHLLSSIITFGLCQGLFLMCSHSYVSLAKYDNVLMIFPAIAKHPELIALVSINLALCVLCAYFFSTQLGYSFAIFGHNPHFFKHFKISTGYVFIMGIILANGLAGLAGFFFAQTNSLIEMNMGVGKALFCITTLILGKALLQSVKVSIGIPVIGVGCYFLLQQLLLKVGFNLKYFTMVQSVLVLGVLLLVYNKSCAQHDQLGV